MPGGRWLGAGTLTTNEMTVRRMWLAGQEFDNLQFLNSPSTSIEGQDPLDLVRAWAGSTGSDVVLRHAHACMWHCGQAVAVLPSGC